MIDFAPAIRRALQPPSTDLIGPMLRSGKPHARRDRLARVQAFVRQFPGETASELHKRAVAAGIYSPKTAPGDCQLLNRLAAQTR